MRGEGGFWSDARVRMNGEKGATPSESEPGMMRPMAGVPFGSSGQGQPRAAGLPPPGAFRRLCARIETPARENMPARARLRRACLLHRSRGGRPRSPSGCRRFESLCSFSGLLLVCRQYPDESFRYGFRSPCQNRFLPPKCPLASDGGARFVRGTRTMVSMEA
jgi:hypothetical protein